MDPLSQALAIVVALAIIIETELLDSKQLV